MSTTVDNRIVEMQFDNKHFENNVATSISTLDKLKKSLNLDGAAKGLNGISSAARKVDMSPIGRAAETVGLKFSAMYTMADQYLRRMTDRIANVGESMIKALTIEPVMTGFSEYETKIGSIQTIMSNTASKGTTMADVTRVIDELNTYADKTIYNFAEMTRNIGTFTAAGVGLEESASAIQGIANLAASSGSTSQQASTAMYQLSQALAAGTVKLMDWNSVVNAGMGGEKFQEALKATARDHGIAVDELIEKNGSFRDSLQEGWISADILNETLNKFTVDGAKNYAKSMVDSGKWTQKQADALVKEAQAMEDAATKVKTFTQLWDTMKESAQSGWGKTWELIVGDFEESRTLWTGVSEVLNGMIEKSANARNDMLEGALSSNWEKLTKKINEAGIETADFEEKVRSIAKKQGKDVDKLVEEYGSLEKVFQKGALSSDILNEALGKMGESMNDLSGVTRELKNGLKGDDVKKVEKALTSLGYSLTGKDGKNYGEDGYFGTLTRDAIKAFQEAEGLEVTGIVDDKTLKALEEATTKTKDWSKEVNNLIDNITELGGREKLIASLKLLFLSFKDIVKPIGKAFREIFPRTTSEQITNLIDSFYDLTKSFRQFLHTAKGQKVIKNITSIFKGFFSAIDIGIDFILNLGKGVFNLLGNFGGLASGILGAAGSLGDWLTNLRDSVKESDFFGKSIDKIVSFLQNGIDKIKEFGSFIGEKIAMPGFEGFLNLMSGIWDVVQKVGGKIAEIGKSIGSSLMGALSSDNIMSGADILNSGLFAGILLWANKFVKGLADTFDGSDGILGGITDILDSVKGCLEAWQADIKAWAILKIAGALAILAGSLWVISAIDPTKLTGALAGIGVLFGELAGFLKLFSMIELNTKGMLTSAAGMIGMSVAILILASAVKSISSLDWEEIAKGLIGVGVLMGEIAIFLNTAKFGGKAISTSVGIVILATAMTILASACEDFGKMSWSKIGKGLASIGALLLALGAFTKLTGNAKHVISTGVSLVLIGSSMKIFASACKDFESMSWEEIGRGMAGLAGALAAVSIAANLMPKNMFGIGAGLVVTAAALLIISNALNKMRDTTWDEIGVGLAALGGSIVILAIGLNAMKGALAGSAALLVATASLAVLVPVLTSLGSMKWETIGKGLVAIAGAFAVLGIAGALLGPMVPAILGLAGSLALIGVATVAFGAGVAALAVAFGTLATMTAAGATAIVSSLTIIITGIVALIPAILTEFGKGIVAFCKVIGDSATEIGQALTDVILASVNLLADSIPALADGLGKILIGLMDALATYTPQLVDKLLTFLIGVFDGVAGRAPELTQSLTNMIAEVLAGLVDAISGIDMSVISKAVIGFGLVAVLAKVVSGIGPSIPGAIVGLVGVGILVAEIGAIVAALGALAQLPGLEWLISEGGDFLQVLGNALGKFVGGLAGGVAEGFTSSLPQIANDLSTFMDNLKPFVDGAKSIDASAMEGVNTIASIILKLTAADIMDGLTSWITGGSSISDFATELATLGGAIVTLSSTLSEVAPEDISKIDSVAGAIESMVAVADKIPETGGLAQAIAGAPDLVAFAGGLSSLGTAVGSFTSSVSEVTPEDLTKISSVAGAVESITALADKIPETGGLAQAIAGAPDLATFAGEMTTLGTSVATFCGSVAEVTEADISKITSIGNAASALVGVASSLEGYNDSSWFNTNLTEFAGEMVNFGNKIKEYAGVVSGIDLSGSVAIANRARAFLSLAIAVSASGDASSKLVDFAGDLESFGKKLSNFYKKIADLDAGKFSTIASGLSTLAAIDVSNADTLQSFIDSLGKVSSDGIDSFVKSISDAAPKVLVAGGKLMENLVKGISSKSKQVGTAFKTALASAVTSISTYYASFSSAGGYLVEGFAAGISANSYKAAAAASAMAKAAKQAAESALGIASPAKEMIEDGEFTTEGFAKGILGGISTVYKAGQKTAEYAKRGFSDAVSRVSDLIANGVDTEPTIRPVLDLSEVSAGADKINGMLAMNPSVGAMANVSAISSMMSRRQNGPNGDVVSAINDLGKRIGSMPGTVNNNYVNGVSYNDGSDVADAIGILVRAVTMEGRA